MEPPTADEKCKIAKRFLSDKAATELERHGFYFKYYDALFGKKPGDDTTPAYLTHGYVVLYFGTLIRYTWQNKGQFSAEFAANVDVKARESAIRALLQASLMIDCASKQNLVEGRNVGDFVNQTWKEDQPFARFVECCFPSHAFRSPEVRKASQTALEQRGRLKAWKLTKHFKVRLRPTDNLAEHLVFDSERRILHVFRHVGFLKAHLYRSRDEVVDISVGNSLEK
ncbi:uncharacterized protein J4E78_005184 [Alternaria triticimaculans]|uniref:uncharacterized protein n=1 Tax=Alternaria triticimaculans TaxID=297637 RepID=UPI0020C516C9|nr:uncharacterized protein J4E78_005184 [Alternaria triticimaculans]KAI4660481.1 hypothetical protein J4E78_005184 [Alternaria triticimaculans]